MFSKSLIGDAVFSYLVLYLENERIICLIRKSSIRKTSRVCREECERSKLYRVVNEVRADS